MKWKNFKVPGYPYTFEINTRGQVRCVDVCPTYYTKLVKSNGYWALHLGKKNIYVHRLVGKFFVKNPRGYKFLEFKDGKKTNPAATNLRWVKSARHVEAGKLRTKIILLATQGFNKSEISRILNISRNWVGIILKDV